MNNKVKRCIGVLQTVLYISIGWIIIVPLTYLIKKKPKTVTFIGRDNGKLLDNVKHFFLYVINNKTDLDNFYFLTEDTQTYKYLKSIDAPVVY